MSYAICLKCNEILQSRHRHDYVTCHCDNKTMLDGGDEYLRTGGMEMTLVKAFSTQEEFHKYLKKNNKVIRNIVVDGPKKPVKSRSTKKGS